MHQKAPLSVQERRVRTRSIIGCAMVLLCVLGLALAVLLVQIAHEHGLGVAQQQSSQPILSSSSSKTGPLVRGPQQTEVPALVELLGLTRTQAIEQLGRGAREVDDQSGQQWLAHEGLWVITVALTEEVAEGQEGPPIVRLGLDEADRVRSAEYSVALESLGYSKDLSFRQALNLLHVIEGLFDDAGLAIPASSARAPEEPRDYTNYLSDGTTVSREYAEFSGSVEQDERRLHWQASLEYDYEKSLKTGNLADAHHIISILVAS